ncbi:MAG: hypothetical protein KAJ06_12085, partial [Gammaproteobacteria bacterium]|nr:hypothetical protein [Gammaproteobacteria bacterium]
MVTYLSFRSFGYGYNGRPFVFFKKCSEKVIPPSDSLQGGIFKHQPFNADISELYGNTHGIT